MLLYAGWHPAGGTFGDLWLCLPAAGEATSERVAQSKADGLLEPADPESRRARFFVKFIRRARYVFRPEAALMVWERPMPILFMLILAKIFGGPNTVVLLLVLYVSGFLR